MTLLADIEWPILRRSLITFGVCLLVCVGLIAGSHYFKQIKQKQYNKNHRLFLEISRRYLAVDQEKQLIDQYYSEFVRAYDNGLIGDEHRLNWMETLRQSDAIIKLPALGYEVLSQRPFSPAFSVNTGPYQLYASEMHLTLGLLHEGDLLDLLNYLDQHAEGLYSVSECQFNRSQQQIDLETAPDQANISARCVLQWFTIDLAEGKPLEWS